MPKRKLLLLDRDGVLNEDTGFVSRPEDFRFKEGVFPFLRAASDSGYTLAIVTNQSGVARGLYDEAAYWALTDWYLDALRQEGIAVALVLACFFHPTEAILPAYARASFWRKPAPGMVLEAALRLEGDLSRSVLLGDARRDCEAGLAAGVGACLWLGGREAFAPSVHCVASFTEALTFLPTSA